MKINNATPIVNTNPAPKKDVAFNGSFKEKGIELLNLKRQGPMSRDLFVINAFAFLLGTRLVTSRDKDEKREILIRDIPTILIAVMGVPVFQDLLAGSIQKGSGFAFMEENTKPIAEQSGIIAPRINQLFGVKQQVVSYAQLKDWYVFDKNLASGFEGFTDRLENQKGNLKKIFASLSDDIKTKLEALNPQFKDKKFGFKDKESGIKDKIVADNKLFKDTLFNKSKKSNEVLELIKQAFSEADNKALKEASWMKTLPTLVGLVLTLGLVGFFIPKLNIHITETINKKRQSEEKSDAPSNVAND